MRVWNMYFLSNSSGNLWYPWEISGMQYDATESLCSGLVIWGNYHGTCIDKQDFLDQRRWHNDITAHSLLPVW